MPKDFDSWNSEKKNIDSNAERKLYHAREIWWCRLGVNVGSEQDGTGTEHERPVLIIKGLSREVCIVLPLTSSERFHSMRVPLGIVGDKKASAIISQIRVVDTKRFIEKVCFIDDATFETIRKAVRELF